jgi:hypothetical protein
MMAESRYTEKQQMAARAQHFGQLAEQRCDTPVLSVTQTALKTITS